MKQNQSPSYPIQIWIAGDHAKAQELCRAYCDETGFCVTVTPTTYIYRDGQASGLVVGLINYPRFPQPEAELWDRAYTIALRLIDGLEQQSCTIQAPDKTLWISFREADAPPPLRTPPDDL